MRTLVHAHTSYSRDGRYSPAALAGLARRHGFGAVLISDHFEHLDRESFESLVGDCSAATACLLVPGYERSWNGFHICAFGISEWVGHAELETWAEAIRSRGGLLCLAHPSRYGYAVPERILALCDAVEVWNSKRPYDGGLAPGPPAFELLGAERLALAGQDLHRRRDLTSVGIETRGVASGAELLSEIRRRRYEISSRFLRFGQRPPAGALRLSRAWQRLRPRLWAPPLLAHRWWRRLRGGRPRRDR